VVGFDVVDTLLFLLVEYPDKSFEVNVFDLCQDGAPPLATLPLANSDVASVIVISRDPIFFTLADSSHSVLGTFLFSRNSSAISPAQFGLPPKANALVLRDGSLFSLALDYTTLHIARVGEGKHEPCTELDISVTSSPILDFLPTVTSSISESKQPTSLVLFTKQEFSPGHSPSYFFFIEFCSILSSPSSFSSPQLCSSPHCLPLPNVISYLGVGSYFLHLKLGDSARNHVLSWHPNEGVIMAAGLHTRGQGAAQTKEVLVCISDGDTGLLFEFTLA